MQPALAPLLDADLAHKVADTQAVLTDLLRRGEPLLAALSGGKDSTTLANLLLMAALTVQREGIAPRVYIGSADTEIENPEVAWHLETMLDNIRAWSRRTGVAVGILRTRPALASAWVVRVLSGQQLPTTRFSRHRACAVDLKMAPLERARNSTRKTGILWRVAPASPSLSAPRVLHRLW